MANGNTVAQWQQAKDALVAQSNQLYAQYATLKQQGTQLAFQSADLYKQLKVTTDPVQRAQLQAQFDNVQTQLQQNNTKIDENQSQQETIGNQIETANTEISRASSGTPNTNAVTSPASSEPGNNTTPAPLAPLETPAVQYSVPPQLRIEVSPIGGGEFSYDVVDTERGKIIKSFDTQAEANAYVVSQGGAPGSTPSIPNQQVQNTAPTDTTDPSSANAVNGSDLASDQATTIANQRDPSSAEYISEADRLSDAASQKIAAQKDPSSAEYISESDRLSDAASQTIQNQKDPSSAEYVNEADRASDAAAAAAEAARNAAKSTNAKGLTTAKTNAQGQAVQRNASDLAKAGDWRVRLSLAPGADYLYKSPIEAELGILAPLKATDGIIFPYTPAISVAYNASYDATELTHSNYKMYQYKASSVDNINITCEFTAQDTQEANYLLATIHFLRSVTKMFYGQDKAPAPGTPPPLVYLTGLGAFQFDRHPLAITNFNYTLPNEVDYIRAGKPASPAGAPTNTPAATNKPSLFSQVSSVASRLFGSNLLAGAQKAPPQWKTIQTGKVSEPTYVPTKMTIQITAVPIVSRGDISNRFGLLKYGTGDLLRGSKNNTGGIW